ncbi:MAG: hypothetical protein HYT94_01130 [Parcubacteria group bacterium]|nr:hypothetical protein [Parcubacteria group bacterium]
MKINKILVLPIAGAAIIAGLLFYFRHDIPLFDFLFKTERDAGGEVSVSVIPQFENGIDFKISMDTHAGELSADMMRAAVFEDEDGTVLLPTSWEGDPPGGHHREGILHFGTFAPMPKKVDFTLLGIGTVKERKFSWMVPLE